MRIFFLEFISECEGYNGQTSVVVGAVLARIKLLLSLLKLVIALLPMNITDLMIISNNVLYLVQINSRNGTSRYAPMRDLAVEHSQVYFP